MSEKTFHLERRWRKEDRMHQVLACEKCLKIYPGSFNGLICTKKKCKGKVVIMWMDYKPEDTPAEKGWVIDSESDH